MLDEPTLRDFRRRGLSAHEMQVLQDALARMDGAPQGLDTRRYGDLLAHAAQGGDPLAVKLVGLGPRDGALHAAALAYGAMRQQMG